MFGKKKDQPSTSVIQRMGLWKQRNIHSIESSSINLYCLWCVLQWYLWNLWMQSILCSPLISYLDENKDDHKLYIAWFYLFEDVILVNTSASVHKHPWHEQAWTTDELLNFGAMYFCRGSKKTAKKFLNFRNKQKNLQKNHSKYSYGLASSQYDFVLKTTHIGKRKIEEKNKLVMLLLELLIIPIISPLFSIFAYLPTRFLPTCECNKDLTKPWCLEHQRQNCSYRGALILGHTGVFPLFVKVIVLLSASFSFLKEELRGKEQAESQPLHGNS